MYIPSGLPWWTNAGQEDLLDSASWGLHAQCIAVVYLNNNASEILLLAGERLSIRLVVFPQTKLLFLSLAFSNAQFISACLKKKQK